MLIVLSTIAGINCLGLEIIGRHMTGNMNAGQSFIPIPITSVSVDLICLFCVAAINALRTNGKTKTSK